MATSDQYCAGALSGYEDDAPSTIEVYSWASGQHVRSVEGPYIHLSCFFAPGYTVPRINEDSSRLELVSVETGDVVRTLDSPTLPEEVNPFNILAMIQQRVTFSCAFPTLDIDERACSCPKRGRILLRVYDLWFLV